MTKRLKDGYYAVNFVVVVRIFDGSIVRVTDGFQGSEVDLTIWRHHIQPDMYIWVSMMGDRGFRGESQLIIPKGNRRQRLSEEDKSFNDILQSYRAKVEQINARIKIFAITKPRKAIPNKIFAHSKGNKRHTQRMTNDINSMISHNQWKRIIKVQSDKFEHIISFEL
jgi:hypothetical protein